LALRTHLQTLYQAIAKRNSVYVTSIFAAAFAFSIGYDQATSAFFDHWNKGVSPPAQGCGRGQRAQLGCRGSRGYWVRQLSGLGR
jgi:hypothetical protein